MGEPGPRGSGLSGSAAPAALGGLAALLAVVTAGTARPPENPLPDRVEYLRRWSRLHGGYQPAGTVFTARWLALVYLLARPLAGRGWSPDVLTGWGVLVSAAVPTTAAAGGRWPLLAALIVVVAGVLDNVDGAVAVLTGRATRFGYVLDSVADRVSDGAYLVALWLLGAPGEVCVAGGALMMLQEYARARAGSVGVDEILVVTVGERPTRVVVTAATLLGCGLAPAAELPATAGAWCWLGLGAVGLTQLLVVLRRHLRP